MSQAPRRARQHDKDQGQDFPERAVADAVLITGSVTMPDRFAAAFPDEGPVTQGAYTGADFAGCDNYTYQEYSFCFEQANNGTR